MTLLFFTYSCICIAQTEIFKGSFEQLENTAKKQHKPYIVDFSTSWCGYCKKFDREVMPDSSFSSLVNQQFLFGRVDGDAQKDLVMKYGVRGYPTFIIFNEKGEEIRRFNGYVDAQSFVKSLNYLGYKTQATRSLSFKEYNSKKQKQLLLLTKQSPTKDLVLRSIQLGKVNDVLSKEDLIIDNPKMEAEIIFYYNFGQNGFDIKQVQQAIDNKSITTEEAHQLLMTELLASNKKLTTDYLILVNTMLLQNPKNYYLLDTKAFIYCRLGQIKNGEETAKEAKKIASKNKLDYSATVILLKLN